MKPMARTKLTRRMFLLLSARTLAGGFAAHRLVAGFTAPEVADIALLRALGRAQQDDLVDDVSGQTHTVGLSTSP